MKVERSKAKGQTAQAPIELKIEASMSKYSFEIIASAPTEFHHKPGAPTDSLGTLSATSGKTDSQGKATIIFTPNGNYGKMTFKVKHGNIESELEPYENKGEFREDAQQRLQDEIDKANLAFDAALITYSTGIGIIAAGMAYLARNSAWVEALIAITTLLAIYYVWLTLKNDLQKGIKKLKEKNQPKIDELPSKL